MTRKAFIADVAAAAAENISDVVSVLRGDDDGDVNFCYLPPSGDPIEIGLLATDVPGYPAQNTYMIFTRSADVPPNITTALEQLTPLSRGMGIPELVRTISVKLHKLLATGSRDDPWIVDEAETAEESEDYGDISGIDTDDDYEIDDGFGPLSGFGERPAPSTTTYHISPQSASRLNRRIKEDLRPLKFAGMKLGILSGMRAESQTSVLSISLQVAKLGLSDEAMQAWDLEPKQYVVLLIKYSGGYKTFDAIISEPAKSHEVSFRIGVSNKYKPTVLEALAAFTDVSHNTHPDSDKDSSDSPLEHESASNAGFRSLFISSSLNHFMDGQFISLLKIRHNLGVGWDGAKRYYSDKQGLFGDREKDVDVIYLEELQPTQNTLPDVISSDHLEAGNDKQFSFPLIATQFALRYLIRCTEFCLVCHDKIDGEFEALKPYVCNKPLCLYQYMSLGFGPSIEHEILTQPYVVDLLVSFCYASAKGRRLREYPTGMSLLVPWGANGSFPNATGKSVWVNGGWNPPPPNVPAANGRTLSEKPESMKVKVDFSRLEVIFEDGQACPVRGGDWVVISIVDAVPIHYRVHDVSLYPTIKLSDIGVTPASSILKDPRVLVPPVRSTQTATPPPALVPAHIMIYDRNFDDMDNNLKADTIAMLLDTVPSIKDMRAYLMHQSRFSEPSLRTWKERVSPAALGILRWIIASNRSCIVQVDKCPGQDDADVAKAKIRLDQKVSNVSSSWVQFRFAQGSPDKEQRFFNALKEQQAKLHPKYPTLFAFHGSPVNNWHSIIRQGLDFKDTLHGRAYGHGVYHSQDQNVSVGYSQQYADIWPSSQLGVQSAMALNEIVNCTAEFQSSNPYLVVQHVDWIQCRYLFVRTGGGGRYNENAVEPFDSTTGISAEVEQDPSHTARSTGRQIIGVPQCAVTVSRAFRVNSAVELPVNKKLKSSATTNLMSAAAIVSDEEEVEDLAFLFSEDEMSVAKVNSKGNGKGVFEDELVIMSPGLEQSAKSLTGFVPGSLDQDRLPLLNPPSYATTSATLRLNKELRTILKTQQATPLHELGWYINKDLVENVYQWIVELHSFDPTLPLAKDMEKAGVTSIVLEIRFGKDFPHSPPFVRIIRPRFVPFMSGGGGHVTGGGAMCMELLTNSGWSAVSSIESVLLQVRLAISSLEPKPARLEITSKYQVQRDYGTAEAMDAYIRSCRAHGWQVPKDFQDFASGSSNG